MNIRRIVSNILCSNMYLVVEEDHAIVIDPNKDISAGEGLQIDKILLTHEHYDHISGVNAWKAKYHAPVLCSDICATNIKDSKKNHARYFSVLCEIQTWIALEEYPDADQNYACSAEETFRVEYSFNWMGHVINLFELPGHSAGSIGILIDNHYLFAGDSILPGSKTELRFPGGNRKA